MDIVKLLDIALKLDLPGIAGDILEIVETVKTTAARAADVLSDADRAELDRVHADALAANAALDAKLADAEGR